VYVLVWKAGPNGEREVRVAPGHSVTVGRDEACDVTLDDEAASRQHARLTARDDGIEIDDLGSRNGTWLGGKQITSATWTPGKTLRVGDTVFSLRKDADLSDQDTVVTRKPAPGAKSVRAMPGVAGASNFIARHWRGQYSIGRSLFINTLLLSVVLAFVMANLTELVAADSSPRVRIIFVTISFLISLAILIWQIVGDWRSLRGAKARGAGRRSRWPAAVFILLLVLGAPFSVFEYATTFSALRDIETGRTSGGESAYSFSTNGNVLTFNGIVSWPIVAEFRQQLDQDPNINVVVLNSPGGDTTAGRRVADLLRERQITTAVLESCASACTLIYSGGPRRVIGPTAELGFHATSVILMDPMMTRIMNSFTFRHDTLNADTYRRAGISEDFVERAISTPSTDLWVPPHDILVQAGVVHEILQP
jgi:ATP-dependent protease ClpP protease subunit